ncbi:MAG: hypothetical protein LC734_02975 [Acidobacteria bacterium]|nr:hypothetical protein [Acidobacteriota bacterium]
MPTLPSAIPGAKSPPCRITEIGAYRVERGTVIGEFHTLVNPQTPIPPFITSLTGISDEMVRNAPIFREVIDPFLDFIGHRVLVAHNARFDMSFLNSEIGRVYENYRVGNPAVCTVQLARRLVFNTENHKLKTLAAYFAVDLINHHRASDDARATATIFINLLSDLQQKGVCDLAALTKFVTKSHYARRSRVSA